MNVSIATPRRLILRDLVIFQIKLVCDGLKDIVLTQVSIFAALVDLAIGGRRRGRIFYGALRTCERFDLWLNLYSASARAGRTAGGLLEERPRGADSLLSVIELTLAAGWRFLRGAWRSGRESGPSPIGRREMSRELRWMDEAFAGEGRFRGYHVRSGGSRGTIRNAGVRVRA